MGHLFVCQFLLVYYPLVVGRQCLCAHTASNGSIATPHQNGSKTDTTRW